MIMSAVDDLIPKIALRGDAERLRDGSKKLIFPKNL